MFCAPCPEPPAVSDANLPADAWGNDSKTSFTSSFILSGSGFSEVIVSLSRVLTVRFSSRSFLCSASARDLLLIGLKDGSSAGESSSSSDSSADDFSVAWNNGADALGFLCPDVAGNLGCWVALLTVTIRPILFRKLWISSCGL